jgi:DNA-binding response OmpR family regulator
MKRILIVEDDPNLREILVTKFMSEKFGVMTAVDGDEALKTALGEQPDIILLDIMMPGLNGISVLKQLRTDEWGKTVPIIIMSNLDYSVHSAEVSLYKPTDYIMKASTKVSEIVDKVKKALSV